MIIFTLAMGIGSRPVAIAQTSTHTTAAACAQVKRETQSHKAPNQLPVSLPQLGESADSVQVVVLCVPEK